MNGIQYSIVENKIIIRSPGRMCETPEELISSGLFKEVLHMAVRNLQERQSMLLGIFGTGQPNEENLAVLQETFLYLCKMQGSLVPRVVEGAEVFFEDPLLFDGFIEYLYNFWRTFDRFVICTTEGDQLDKRPYRTFNETIEKLTHLTRATYRDVRENLTGHHPNIYRQVRAGAEIASIAFPRNFIGLSAPYNNLNRLFLIRQVLLYPPLVLNPPMNKRAGSFIKVDRNPLEHFSINEDEWLCYPAKVGHLLILICFHEKFYELGFSLCNLFELAADEDLKRKPDAVYAFGVPGDALDDLAEFPTIFFDDTENDLLVAAVPGRDEFGYFGYLKKMVLTLHNITVMKSGRLPFHGALVRIVLQGGGDATVLIIGDTGAGKSETLESFRLLGVEHIREMIIIADDMGSLDRDDSGHIIGYGTETGAFLRLDDLQPGYAFGQIDRSIIMSPSQTNARIVLPVTTYEDVVRGYHIDYILYANNYEEVDDDHPVIERFPSAESALHVFREGAVMSKGTTSTKGLVHSYFANIFGPPQYKDLHEKLAGEYFPAFFDAGVFVGQIRTRLGIPGMERTGPESAAKELLRLIADTA